VYCYVIIILDFLKVIKFLLKKSNISIFFKGLSIFCLCKLFCLKHPMIFINFIYKFKTF